MTAAERQLDRTALLAVPGILVVLLLFIYPFLHGLVLSFEPKEGGGLANYLRFFSQPFLAPGLAITFCLCFVQAFSVFPSAALLGAPAGRRESSPSPLTPPPSRSTTIRWRRRSR
jgi:ABC-type sugar transport system permease subunit